MKWHAVGDGCGCGNRRGLARDASREGAGWDDGDDMGSRGREAGLGLL